MNGIINIYKEKGFTSHDVVAKLRGILKMKKIGHTGTLDPGAEGVLPVCIGNATRVCDLITNKDKAYRAVLLLGKTTDTQDVWGNVLSEKPISVSENDVVTAINSFVGEYDQVPPMYSAIKIGGKKLYELARKGETIDRPPRHVVIKDIKIIDMSLPRVTMEVSCSKGTYIRTLCHDIGEKLCCGGVMEELLRIRSGEFILSEARKLSEIEELAKNGGIETILMPVDTVFKDLESLQADESIYKLLVNGNPLPEKNITSSLPDAPGRVRLYDHRGSFAGIYEYKKSAGIFKPVKLFF
ncbi:MAG: tRNA pseudouridine(55) synthase TruB [Lachnospiraceae bacterium]|nr:tRNA pseudouridine(55) synthase TruB [Lachnospiraceae bacterium]